MKECKILLHLIKGIQISSLPLQPLFDYTAYFLHALYVGNATRVCGRNGEWLGTDVSNCLGVDFITALEVAIM